MSQLISIQPVQSVPPLEKKSRSSSSFVDLSQVEIIDRGDAGKFIYAPLSVRKYIYVNLDIEGLFHPKSLDILEEDLADYQRRAVKNTFSVPVLEAISRLNEIQEGLGDFGTPDDEEVAAQLGHFIRLLEEEEMLLEEKFGKGIPGEVTAEELTLFLNSKGKNFAYRRGDVTFGFITQSAGIKRTFFGNYVEVVGLIHASYGEGIMPVQYRFELPYFSGRRHLSEIGIFKLDEDKETFDRLVERGKRYVQLVSRPSYMRYQGPIVRRAWWSDRKYKADGRVMIDIAAMRNIDPDYEKYFGWERYERRGRDGGKLTEFTDEQYASMSPYVYGFSFASKVWGEMLVDNVSEISFREDAYDMLVMEPKRKDMIFALVENSVSGPKDFIDGKGGGCIFLLAGPPGGGKTLTAEAIAERLKRPLYMVGVGELGTDVNALEESLRKILDVATTWNAVLLIDECDIFMEERSEMDVHRNAMVGVFLRLLEYYEGVLFLTTNRAKNIDPAFYSRISMALYYEPLDVSARRIVWNNLLKVYGIECSEVDRLAQHELNGRKIKGVIRIACALAEAQGRKPTLEDFERVIDEEQEFKEAVGYDI